MKPEEMFYPLLFVLFLFSGQQEYDRYKIYEQVSSEQMTVDALNALTDFCEGSDYKNASKLMVYKGDDPKRKWKSTLKYGKADEKDLTFVQCSKLLHNLNYGTAKVISYHTESESEGEWHILEMGFPDVPNSQKIQVAFLMTDSGLLLGDIE